MPITLKHGASPALIMAAGYAAGVGKREERDSKFAASLLDREAERRNRMAMHTQDRLWDMARQRNAFANQRSLMMEHSNQIEDRLDKRLTQQREMNELDQRQRQLLDNDKWAREGVRLGEFQAADAQELGRLFDARTQIESNPKFDDQQKEEAMRQINNRIAQIGTRRQKPPELAPADQFERDTVVDKNTGQRFIRSNDGWKPLTEPKPEKPPKLERSDLTDPMNLMEARIKAEKAIRDRRAAERPDTDEEAKPIVVTDEEIDAYLMRQGFKFGKPSEPDKAAMEGQAREQLGKPPERPALPSPEQEANDAWNAAVAGERQGRQVVPVEQQERPMGADTPEDLEARRRALRPYQAKEELQKAQEELHHALTWSGGTREKIDSLIKKRDQLQAEVDGYEKPVRINSDDDYDRLPPGTVFVGPDGKPYQKPGR